MDKLQITQAAYAAFRKIRGEEKETEWCWLTDNTKEAFGAAVDAVFDALPVLTEAAKAQFQSEGQYDRNCRAYHDLVVWLLSRLPARLETAEPAQAVTDEELARIYMDVSGFYYLDYQNAQRIAALCAVRRAVEAPLRAEIERLNEELDSAIRERDALQAKLDAVQSRPARVRFDCTADEVLDEDRRWVKGRNGGIYSHYDRMQNLLDYLAARAVIDVPPQAYVPRSELDAMREERDKIADQLLAMSDPTPIASAETLEQLAEIAENEAEIHVSLEDETFTVNWTEIVTAILRAARARLDVTVGEFRTRDNELNDRRRTSADQDRRELLDWLNSRIRVAVDVPAADSDDLTIAYMSGRKDGQRDTRDDLRERQRECYERVYAIASGYGQNSTYAQKTALEAARTLPERLVELDAALEDAR